jgi:hypothetical protein
LILKGFGEGFDVDISRSWGWNWIEPGFAFRLDLHLKMV